eukprot:12802925-Ditylum_brightwellii.AAC.1
MDSLTEDWKDIGLLVPSLEKANVELVNGGFNVCSFRVQGEDPMNLTKYNASQYTWWVCQMGGIYSVSWSWAEFEYQTKKQAKIFRWCFDGHENTKCQVA